MFLSRYRKDKSIKKRYSLKKSQLGGSRELYIIYIYKIDRYWPMVITKNRSFIYSYLHQLNNWLVRNPSRYREQIAPNIRLSKITQNEDYTVSSPNFEKIDFKDYVEETDDLDLDPMDEEKIFYQVSQDCDGIIKEIYRFNLTPEHPYYNQMLGQYRDGMENSHNWNSVTYSI
jgi:hypothetical protein